MWKVYLCTVSLAITVLACRKKPDPVDPKPVPTNGDLRVTFQNVAGAQPLVLNTGWYVNANGDSLQVSMFKYYISNIVLVKEDGTEVKEPESYHLIDEATNESKSFTIKGIPPGNYTKMKFLIGVDEARNTSGAQTGALDPAHGMFWNWDTGYIMAKLEGISPHSPEANGSIIYHTGGFKGDMSVLRNISLNFPQLVQISATTIPNAHIKADALEWFQTPNQLSIQEYPVLMSGPDLVKLANNYADMFTVDHID
jgi:hypothetical protein